MELRLRTTGGLLLQISALALLSWSATLVTRYLPFPVPAGAVGMCLLFALLASGWLPLRWIERGAALLVRHLGLFLIPYAVSFMAFGDLFAAGGIALLVLILGSTGVGIAVTGWTAQCVASLQIPRLRRIGKILP